MFREARELKNNPVWNRLLSLAKKRNIKVHIASEKSLPSTCNIRGLWMVLLNGIHVIVIKQNLSAKEKNFTMAHELAHAVLHKGSGLSSILIQDPAVKKQEDEANAFAVRLLLFIKRQLYRACG